MTTTRPVLPPLPVADELSAPYWAAAQDRQLVIQRCPRTQRWFHPPQPICDCCSQADLSFEPVSGKGTVYTFSVMRDRRILGFEDRVPYITVWVELDEQPLLIMLANLTGIDASGVTIGMPVEVEFEQLTDEVTLPQFRVVA